MDKSQKDFLGWAKVAEKIDRCDPYRMIKPEVVYWCSFGMGIGSELYGKGKEFTRPGLILAQLTNDLVLIVPITSQAQIGGNYESIVIKGRIEYLNLAQARPVSRCRIGDFIEEVDHRTMPSPQKTLFAIC